LAGAFLAGAAFLAGTFLAGAALAGAAFLAGFEPVEADVDADDLAATKRPFAPRKTTRREPATITMLRFDINQSPIYFFYY
jgi:hypothetical protein